MKPINIYTLTRISNPERLCRLERQLSGRNVFLKIKEWEIKGLRALTDRLCEHSSDAPAYDFFYSFVMPKLGKEFDLIRIASDSVVNIELKSGDVTDEAIRNQLLNNRYYLSTLGRTMHFYTYIDSENRLVRLSNKGKLTETDFDDLISVLKRQDDMYDGDIEDLFKEESYLISPLADSARFLRKEYFLTFQQRDIKKQILKIVKRTGADKERPVPVQGFTGLPGTGKTILLFDLAMTLSVWDKVCLLHFGARTKELDNLNERLKRIDFYYCSEGTPPEITDKYEYILIDVGHKINREYLDWILDLSRKWNAPIVVSYDREDAISEEERLGYGSCLIEEIPEFILYRLTNRIRLNAELSTFINCVMSFKTRSQRKDYPSVSVAYANNVEEAGELICEYEKDGYVFLQDKNLSKPVFPSRAAMYKNNCEIEGSEDSGKEFDKVVVLLDEGFYYDDEGDLRHVSNSAVRRLFHGMSRAKKKIALVIKENERVLDVMLFILQRK
ncbi:MAG: ATP-binding protein [Lachnospiraceae bacterium]|nr:ATP-binding protein [Lachnospiraceae bacterium]